MVHLIYGEHSVELRNPQLGNTDTLDYTRLSRQTTGGDTIIFRDPEWPKIETLKITFDLCDPVLVERIKWFIRLTLGKQFTYIDYLGDSWSALITNPNTAVKQAGINSHVVELELEAERL